MFKRITMLPPSGYTIPEYLLMASMSQNEGWWRCYYCGSAVDNRDRKCPNCGGEQRVDDK